MTEHDVERPPLDAAVLGARLLKEYRAAETARSLYSERWLQDLTAYKGFYPATVATRLKESRKSSVYYRMTTAKVNTMTARLMDLLFPQRARNWSITPTPDPDLPQEILEQELDAEIQAQALLNERLTQLTRKNIVPDDLAMRKLMEGARREAFQNMNTPANRQRAAQAQAQAFIQELEARGMPQEEVRRQLLLMAAQNGMAAQAMQADSSGSWPSPPPAW